jgi:hypothetical protein
MTIGWRSILATSFFRCAALALLVTSITTMARADEFEGPTFRKGLWHFVRTLDMVAHRKAKHRLLERELTACVDPTVAMKATFSSPSVGNCVSVRPEKKNNQYTFANRCDFMGPVSTVITVHSDESYTEQNELSEGHAPRVELVVAHRIGDCGAGSEQAARTLSH